MIKIIFGFINANKEQARNSAVLIFQISKMFFTGSFFMGPGITPQEDN